jgi:hypothetical protein
VKQIKSKEEEEKKEYELECTILALLIYMRGTARYGSTYVLSTVSGQWLRVLGVWLAVLQSCTLLHGL